MPVPSGAGGPAITRSDHNRISWIEAPHEHSTIEVLRGRLDRARASELLSFWAERRALSGDAARRRLPEVVCVLRQGGAIAGVSSAYETEAELIGGQRFWIYRSFLDPEVADHAPEMIRTTFTTLESEFDGAPQSPIGLCMVVSGAEDQRRRPEAEWQAPRMVYAGYLPDGRQVRVGYFAGALITRPGEPPPDSPRRHDSAVRGDYRITAFAEQHDVSPQDVVDLWTGAGVLDPAEAQRRVAEVVAVATDMDDNLVGVSTSYLRHNQQLRAQLWYTRVFVVEAHRRSHLSTALATAAQDHLAARFESGADRRGIGTIFEAESEVYRFLPEAVWPRTQSVFIGNDARGVQLRVHYFPGALAPEPA